MVGFREVDLGCVLRFGLWTKEVRGLRGLGTFPNSPTTWHVSVKQVDTDLPRLMIGWSLFSQNSRWRMDLMVERQLPDFLGGASQKDDRAKRNHRDNTVQQVEHHPPRRPVHVAVPRKSKQGQGINEPRNLLDAVIQHPKVLNAAFLVQRIPTLSPQDFFFVFDRSDSNTWAHDPFLSLSFGFGQTGLGDNETLEFRVHTTQAVRARESNIHFRTARGKVWAASRS